ncbi:MAG: DUF1573 domain-containing protein [Planctomycetota bacterium]|nr:DUF1573 domain-containing protein [Planctomycetota bacterium]
METLNTLPPIRVFPRVLDWGTIDPEVEVEGSVQLQNISDSPLKILAVQSTCKCTATKALDGKIIPPGGQVTLDATLEPQTSVGTRRTLIKVLVEGYAQVLEITAQAEITRPIRVRPQFINTIASGDRQDSTGGVPNQTGSLIVSSMDRKPFQILSVQGRPPTRGPSKAVSGGSQSQHVLTYDIEDYRQPDGRYQRYVVIETDRDDVPLIEVLLRHKNSALDIDPQLKLGAYMLNLGRTAPGGVVTKKHTTREASLTGPMVTATVDEPGITLEIIDQTINEDTDDLTITYKFDVDPAKPEGMYYFPVTLYASNRADITVPAFLSVRNPSGSEGADLPR